MTSDSPPRFTVAEFGRALLAPDAAEQWSPISGPGVIVLDLAASTRDDALHWQSDLLNQLPTLPCVTIALCGPDGRDRDDRTISVLAEVCDVLIRDELALPQFCSGFAQTPIAALAFVQLLRGGPAPTVHAGLVAESSVYSTLQAGAEFRSWLEQRKEKPRSRRPAETGPACRLSRDRGELELLLARPDRHNAFSRAMRDALAEGLQLALADPSIEDVVLRGEGDSFCSGGDLDEFGSFPDPAVAHAIRTTRSPALLVSRLAGRIRSEVHGACIGAGIELPAFTDHVTARDDAFFELPEVRLGLVPGAGGTVSLPRRIGRQRTAWLGLSGARIDASTALEWGLVDEVRLGQHVEAQRRDKR